MREIKFRGKSIKSKEWAYGYAVKRGSEWFIDYETTDWKSQPPLGRIEYHKVKVHENSIGQFIGIKDKSSKMIYEGDVVDTSYDGSTFIGIVVYDISELDFKATDGKEHYKQNFQYLTCCDEIEVIGNIYENTELLIVK